MGSVPAVSGEPIADGRKVGNDGFEAASSRTESGPGSASSRNVVRRGWIPCTGRPAGSTTRPSHWKPAASGWKPRSITASTHRPRHGSGISPSNRNQVVPQGTPQRRSVSGVSCSGNGPRRHGDGPFVGVNQREHPLPELASDPFLDEQAIIVHLGEGSRGATIGFDEARRGKSATEARICRWETEERRAARRSEQAMVNNDPHADSDDDPGSEVTGPEETGLEGAGEHDGPDHDGPDHDAAEHDGPDHDGPDHDAAEHADAEEPGSDPTSDARPSRFWRYACGGGRSSSWAWPPSSPWRPSVGPSFAIRSCNRSSRIPRTPLRCRIGSRPTRSRSAVSGPRSSRSGIGSSSSRSELADARGAIAELEPRMDRFDSDLADLRMVDDGLGIDQSRLRSMELMSRARLFLYQANYGQAEQDVAAAQVVLTRLGSDDVDIVEAIERLDRVVAALPDRPVSANADLDIAWQLLLGDLPGIPVTELEPDAGRSVPIPSIPTTTVSTPTTTAGS